MSFRTFDQNNNWLSDPLTKKNFFEALAAYLNSRDIVQYKEGYYRGTVTPATAVENRATQIWAGLPNNPHLPPDQQLAAKKNHLYTQVDNFVTQTIIPGANGKFLTERNFRTHHYTQGQGLNTFPDLEEFFKCGVNHTWLAKQFARLTQAADYLDLLTAVAQPYLPTDDTAKNRVRYNKSYVQADKAKNAVASARPAIQGGQLAKVDGRVDTAHQRWSTIEECVAYWAKELPAVPARQQNLQQALQWAASTPKMVLKRLIQGGEKDAIVQLGRLTQGPSSYEKHKWFFYGDGLPSVGHDYLVEITMKGNFLTSLEQLAVNVSDQEKADSTQAFIKKTNEHNCIGIHEDILQAFHAQIETMVIKSNNTTLKMTPITVNPAP